MSSRYNPEKAAEQYRQLGLEGEINNASAHRLIQLLFTGALTHLKLAQAALARQELAAKGEHIGRAISIVGGLRASLDDSAGDLTAQLDSLYEYCNVRLLEASRDNNPTVIEEVTRLLSTLQSGWDGIASEVES